MKKTITTTELARNLSRILDQLVNEGGEIVIERNSRKVACLTAAPAQQNALEAMADLYRRLYGVKTVAMEAGYPPAQSK